MSDWLPWIAVALLEAALLHFAIVWWTPRLVGRFSAARILTAAGSANVIAYRGVPEAGKGGPAPNPDLATAFGVYDCSGGPIRIACALPAWDGYWSISLYSSNTDCFCVINDRTAVARDFQLIVSGKPSADPLRPTEMQAVSPSDRGIIVIRMVANRDDAEEMARIEAAIRRTVVAHPAP